MARPLALAATLAASLLLVSAEGSARLQQEPERGGTVVIAAPEPVCLNLVIAKCRTGIRAAYDFAFDVLEDPFVLGVDLRWQPHLVSHVEFTRAAPFVLTFHIRPEARWSDGVPVTAADFAFTHRVYRTIPEPSPVQLHRTEVRSARAVGAKTVRVVLRARFAGWRGLFNHVLPSHALRRQDLANVWQDRLDDPRTGRPIGSGAWLLASFERGRQITLVRNRAHWRPRAAYLDRLVFRFLRDPVAALRRGEIDVTGIPAADVPALRQTPGIRVVVAPGPLWEHVAIRVGAGGHPALRSKLVRRALAFGIDRVALARAQFADVDPELRPSDNAILLNNSRYYRPNWSTYRFRPAHARRLLEQAGCQRGADGIYACAGERLSLRFVTTAGSPRRERAASLIQQQLRTAGVEVVPSFAQSVAFFDQILPQGAYDLALFGFTRDPDAFGAVGVYGCGAAFNVTGYCQRLVTGDLNESELIFDAERRAQVLNRADTRMSKDVPVIPLVQVPQAFGVRDKVRGFVVPPVPPIHQTAENWWLDR